MTEGIVPGGARYRRHTGIMRSQRGVCAPSGYGAPSPCAIQDVVDWLAAARPFCDLETELRGGIHRVVRRREKSTQGGKEEREEHTGW